jgi:succinyl-CoA synthetase alpha subunit
VDQGVSQAGAEPEVRLPRSRNVENLTRARPIAALVAGRCAVEGEIMGHNGAWRGRGESTAEQKWRALEDAGAVMADHPSQFGSIMKRLLKSSSQRVC